MVLNRHLEPGMKCSRVLSNKASIMVLQILLFFVLAQGSDLVYVLVYVDDILIIGNNSTLVDHIIKGLGLDFALKDLGSLHYFLGIEVLQHTTGLILSQTKYATNLLVKAGMTDCRPCASPYSLKSANTSPDPPFSNPEFYRTLVSSIQYLTLTRPELCYVVYAVCQHMHHPLESHFAAVKRILRYVKGTIDQGYNLSRVLYNSLHTLMLTGLETLYTGGPLVVIVFS